jgi:hypothetical protein
MIVQDNDESGESGKRHRAAVRAAVLTRRCRAHSMPAEWFSDPAWDLMIDLYARHMELPGESEHALLPPGPLPARWKRWVAIIVDAGYATDRGGILTLSAKGVESMHACIEEVAASADRYAAG